MMRRYGFKELHLDLSQTLVYYTKQVVRRSDESPRWRDGKARFVLEIIRRCVQESPCLDFGCLGVDLLTLFRKPSFFYLER
jgi:hypothetical protein